MRHSLFRSLAAGAAALCAIAALRASGPAFWVIATSGELLKGTSNGVYITSEGSVMAGPRLTNRVTTTPAQIWSLAAGADDTLWAGTGGDGRVLRIRPGQNDETAFDSDENNVFAIAVSGSRVYAATGPDGRVYVIENGAARPLFDPPEKYIWALAVDKAGRLWVGAGNPAVIYRVDANGTGQAIYHPPAAHVVCLAMDASGRMFAGTESPGRLYRLDNDGAKPFVVLDSGLNELRAVSFGPEGLTFAAALAKGDDNQPSELTSVSAALPLPAQPGASSSSSTPASPRSVVYRIEANGAWEPFWESTDTAYDLAAKDDGGVLVASGPEGRLYRIDPDRRVFLYSGVDAKQVTRILAPLDRNLSVIATANPGRVVSLGPSEQTPATYTSPVKDTKNASTWGIIRWESIGAVAMYTRSGNTGTPDDSWSDWAGPYTRKEGDGVKSPAARFVQWKAVFTRPAAPPLPQLTSVTLAYLPRNTRPTISSIVTHPPGVVFQRPFAGDDAAIAGLDDVTAEARKPPGDAPGAAPVGRRMYQKGLQTIAWKADDGDGDRLSYSLFFRREGDSPWIDLRAGLNDPIFVWDTTAVADGRYVIKVVASDDPSNSGDRALASERESDPIDVDNTPPVITTEIARQAGRIQLVVRVRDAHSAIQKVEYSRDGNRWQLIFPADGLADSPDERYEIPLQNEADAAKVMIRATDALQNVASLSAGKSPALQSFR